VYLKQGVMGIYDPNYNPKEGSRRVKDLANMSTVVELIKVVRKRRRMVDVVYAGRGGNPGTLCNEMCRQWLIEEFIEG
jgi:hypothetical protein